MKANPPTPNAARSRLRLLVGFLAAYIVCAATCQLTSEIPPWEDDSPIDFFTSGLLGMVSLTCLLNADKHRARVARAVFWLSLCVAFAGLAVDEVLAFHERTEAISGDDDHFKILAWIAAGAVLYAVCRLERARGISRAALAGGYLFHSFYMLVELGDGEYFRFPFAPIGLLKWSEEFFELFCVACLLVGFAMIYSTSSRLGR